MPLSNASVMCCVMRVEMQTAPGSMTSLERIPDAKTDCTVRLLRLLMEIGMARTDEQ